MLEAQSCRLLPEIRKHLIADNRTLGNMKGSRKLLELLLVRLTFIHRAYSLGLMLPFLEVLKFVIGSNCLRR